MKNMKLELRHIVPYLPHKLKVVCEGEKTNISWISTNNIAIIRPNSNGEIKRIKWEHAYLNVKPILRPITDLNLRWIKENIQDDITDFRFNRNKLGFSLEVYVSSFFWTGTSYEEISKLFEHHFDVFGLINEGLAININYLKNV